MKVLSCVVVYARFGVFGWSFYFLLFNLYYFCLSWFISPKNGLLCVYVVSAQICCLLLCFIEYFYSLVLCDILFLNTVVFVA